MSSQLPLMALIEQSTKDRAAGRPGSYIVICGCGSSGGVPRAVQGWGECDPANPKNRRRRCAALVERIGENGSTQLWIDCGPDLREQMLDLDIEHLDAVLITHDHADHCHGLDDLRTHYLHHHKPIITHADETTLQRLIDKFSYLFEPRSSGYPIVCDGRAIDRKSLSFSVEGQGGTISVTGSMVKHGYLDVYVPRIGGMVYSPDIKEIIDEKIFTNMDFWLVDCLRDRHHNTHYNVDECFAAIAQYEPKHAILTDLHSDLDYDKLLARLPDNITPAFDGLTLRISDN